MEGAPDALWLVNNWQPANQLMQNIFPSSTHACFGDGVGFFVAEGYGKWPALMRLRHRLGGLFPRPRKRNGLGRLPFDRGYFAFTGFGRPSFPWTRVDLPFSALGASSKVTAEFQQELDGLSTPTLVVLLENLSESEFLSPSEERKLLSTWIQECVAGRPMEVWIKEHPRNQPGTGEALARFLQAQGLAARNFQSPYAWLVPWELLAPRPLLEVATLGTAALGLAKWHGVRAHVGFGKAAWKEMTGECRRFRKRFETDLNHQVTALSEASRSTGISELAFANKTLC